MYTVYEYMMHLQSVKFIKIEHGFDVVPFK
jgi:hypothetical protein